MTQRPNRWAGALVNDTERPGSQVIVEPIVTDHPAAEHRIAGDTPSKHRYAAGDTCPETGQVRGRTESQFVAVNLIKLHGGSLKAISTRRAAR